MKKQIKKKQRLVPAWLAWAIVFQAIGLSIFVGAVVVKNVIEVVSKKDGNKDSNKDSDKDSDKEKEDVSGPSPNAKKMASGMRVIAAKDAKAAKAASALYWTLSKIIASDGKSASPLLKTNVHIRDMLGSADAFMFRDSPYIGKLKGFQSEQYSIISSVIGTEESAITPKMRDDLCDAIAGIAWAMENPEKQAE